jgi:hypothetical protein
LTAVPRKSIALLLVVLAAGLAACGESGPDEDEARAVEDTILGATLSFDPIDCERYYTQDFLERLALGYKGEAALEICEKSAAQGVGRYPRDGTVSNTEIDGEEATADASFVGGTLGGQAVTFALVREGERWKVDRMIEFVEFDRDRLLDGLGREIDDAVDKGLDPEVAACVVDRFEGLEDGELEDLVLYHDPEGVPGIAKDCLREAESTRDL